MKYLLLTYAISYITLLQNSRFDILQVLSKSLQLSSDVDLAEIARATQGFSGADLQAVLYSAQLDAVKGLLDDDEV